MGEGELEPDFGI